MRGWRVVAELIDCEVTARLAYTAFFRTGPFRKTSNVTTTAGKVCMRASNCSSRRPRPQPPEASRCRTDLCCRSHHRCRSWPHIGDGARCLIQTRSLILQRLPSSAARHGCMRLGLRESDGKGVLIRSAPSLFPLCRLPPARRRARVVGAANRRGLPSVEGTSSARRHGNGDQEVQADLDRPGVRLAAEGERSQTLPKSGVKSYRGEKRRAKRLVLIEDVRMGRQVSDFRALLRLVAGCVTSFTSIFASFKALIILRIGSNTAGTPLSRHERGPAPCLGEALPDGLGQQVDV